MAFDCCFASVVLVCSSLFYSSAICCVSPRVVEFGVLACLFVLSLCIFRFLCVRSFFSWNTSSLRRVGRACGNPT